MFHHSATHTDVKRTDGLLFAEELLLRKIEERGRTELRVKGEKMKNRSLLLFFVFLPSGPCWSIKFMALNATEGQRSRRYQDAGHSQQTRRS